MIKLLFILCTITLYFSQDTLYVFRYNFDSETAKFEKTLLENILKLYENKEQKTFHVNYVEVTNFRELFSNLKNEKIKHHCLSMSSITITVDRKKQYDFSPRYLPIRYGVIALKKNKIKNWKNSKMVFGYIKGTTDEIFVKKFNTEYDIRTKGYLTSNEKLKALHSNEIDVMLSEIISNFKNDKLMVIENILLKENGYGMMFPKGSILAKSLKKYTSYYTKSKKYYLLLRKSYGKDIAKILHQEISRD